MAGLPGGTLSITNANPAGMLSLSMSQLAASFRETRGSMPSPSQALIN